MPSKIPAAGATQRDIARLLDLSRSTVAFALNPKHQHKLQAETVQLVQRKAAELNYHPRREAQILRQGRSNSIGVVFRTPRYYAAHEGASYLPQAILSQGYQPTAVDLQWFTNNEKVAQSHLIDSSPDGVILNNLTASDVQPWEEFLLQRGIPFVRIGEVVPREVLNSSVIGADRLRAFRELTKHHLELGSRSFALLLPQPISSRFQRPRPLIYDRFTGFREAILAAGGVLEAADEVARIFDIKCPTKRPGKQVPRGHVLHIELDVSNVADAFRMGYDYVTQAHRTGELPESVICSNDDVAAGAITAAIELAIPIPQRLKVSGADDASFSAYCGVPITTIRPPTVAMVDWAMDELFNQITHRHTPPPPRQMIFPYELIVRRSTFLP